MLTKLIALSALFVVTSSCKQTSAISTVKEDASAPAATSAGSTDPKSEEEAIAKALCDAEVKMLQELPSSCGDASAKVCSTLLAGGPQDRPRDPLAPEEGIALNDNGSEQQASGSGSGSGAASGAGDGACQEVEMDALCEAFKTRKEDAARDPAAYLQSCIGAKLFQAVAMEVSSGASLGLTTDTANLTGIVREIMRLAGANAADRFKDPIFAKAGDALRGLVTKTVEFVQQQATQTAISAQVAVSAGLGGVTGESNMAVTQLNGDLAFSCGVGLGLGGELGEIAVAPSAGVQFACDKLEGGYGFNVGLKAGVPAVLGDATGTVALGIGYDMAGVIAAVEEAGGLAGLAQQGAEFKKGVEIVNQYLGNSNEPAVRAITQVVRGLIAVITKAVIAASSGSVNGVLETLRQGPDFTKDDLDKIIKGGGKVIGQVAKDLLSGELDTKLKELKVYNVFRAIFLGFQLNCASIAVGVEAGLGISSQAETGVGFGFGIGGSNYFHTIPRADIEEAARLIAGLTQSWVNARNAVTTLTTEGVRLTVEVNRIVQRQVARTVATNAVGAYNTASNLLSFNISGAYRSATGTVAQNFQTVYDTVNQTVTETVITYDRAGPAFQREIAGLQARVADAERALRNGIAQNTLRHANALVLQGGQKCTGAQFDAIVKMAGDNYQLGRALILGKAN